jgi:YgiT-type zinc finger domain-containing protein
MAAVKGSHDGVNVNCEFCKGSAVGKKVKRQHWLRGVLYIVENVEAEVCTECGQRYFHASTLDDIDRFLESDHEVESRINVEVVRVA